VFAYRVNSNYDNSEEEGYEQGYNNQEDYVTEGFEDGSEEGCGQKMLSLLQKMGAENILILVFIWHTRMPGHFSNEVYKMVLDRTKDLVSTLHMKVFESE